MNRKSNKSTSDPSGGQNNGKGTGFFNVLQSAVAAAFGVQSAKNRERDFAHGKPVHFIAAGILLTITFLLLIGLFVKIMINTNS